MRKLLLLAIALVPSSLLGQCGSQLAASSDTVPAYVIYIPTPSTCFNGSVIMYAHGYIAQGSAPDTWKSHLILPDGTSLPALLNSLGFGFAASGFSKDGLAIPQGMKDTKDLATLIQQFAPVQRFYVTGASEGGLIATKLLEEDTFFAGGTAVCGPVGDIQKQLNYVGDTRVLFDYFFPNVLPGDVTHVPPELVTNWAKYEADIKKAVKAKPLETLQLLSAAQITVGLDFANAGESIARVLWYDVFGFEDAKNTLGGIPFDNTQRVYKGSFDDRRLNARVLRVVGDPAVAVNLPKYNTTGRLKNPLVTLHTIWDPVVPYDHEAWYGAKVAIAGKSSELIQLPSFQYGHCQVSVGDAVFALALTILKSYFSPASLP